MLLHHGVARLLCPLATRGRRRERAGEARWWTGLVLLEPAASRRAGARLPATHHLEQAGLVARPRRWRCATPISIRRVLTVVCPVCAVRQVAVFFSRHSTDRTGELLAPCLRAPADRDRAVCPTSLPRRIIINVTSDDESGETMAVTLTQRNLGAAPTEIRLAYVEHVGYRC